MRVGNGNKFSVASSMNNIKIKQQSKDASIAEVNEDLYRDSVESFGT